MQPGAGGNRLDTEVPGKPAYRHIADELRSAIAEGQLPVGAAVGSTARLMKQYRVSSTVARKAVEQLRTEGLVVGRPGKGVFVKATPSQVAVEVPTLARLAEEIQDLRRAVKGLEKDIDSPLVSLERRVDDLEAQVVDLRANAGLLRSANDEGNAVEAR